MTSTTTSSSSGREPGAEPSGTGSPRVARRCSGWNAGPFLPRERDNWETQAVFVRGKYLASEVWYDGHGREFQPEVNYYVGGNTKFYGAALFRLRPEDFGELRHHGGISPGLADLLRRARALLHAGRAPLPRARRARRGPERGPGERAVRLPSGVPRTPHPAAERRPGEAGPPPVPPADRGQPPGGGSRASRPGRARASAATGSTASRAWWTPSRTRRSSVWIRSCPRTTSPS